MMAWTGIQENHDAASSPEADKFQAAVKVVNNMPKDGPFQASNELKLQFYALYKQATVGKCCSSKPGFWDVVNRAKWDAWNSLGSMSKEEAMQGYVSQMKQIVDTMSLDDNVQEFLAKNSDMFDGVSVSVSNCTTGKDHKRNGYSSEAEHSLIEVSTLMKEKPTVNGNLPNGHVNGVEGREGAMAAIVAPTPVAVANGISYDNHKANNGAVLKIIDGAHTPASDIQSEEDDAFADADDSLTPTPDDNCAVEVKEAETKLGGTAQAEVSLETNEVLQLEAEATSAVGSALRDVSGDIDLLFPTTVGGGVEDRGVARMLEDAWRAVEETERDRRRRTERAREERELWPVEDLLRQAKGRKTRGREDEAGGGSGKQDSGHASTSGNQGQGVDGSTTQLGPSRRAERWRRDASGSDESSDTGGGEGSWDPQVAAVMYRMHREMQRIGHQLDLMEQMLVTQQRLIHSSLTQLLNPRWRLWFFTHMPWRTILFIVVWPFVVNVMIRLFWRRFTRKRR